MERAGSSRKAKLLLIVLWLNFVFLWIHVYRMTTVRDVGDSFNYIGGLISAYGILVTIWIFHNIRIYKKKGPRKSARLVELKGTHDALKRVITRQVDLKSEQEIVVDIVGGKKLFIHGERKPEEAVALTLR